MKTLSSFKWCNDDCASHRHCSSTQNRGPVDSSTLSIHLLPYSQFIYGLDSTFDSSTGQYSQFIYKKNNTFDSSTDSTPNSSTNEPYFLFIYWQYFWFIYYWILHNFKKLTIKELQLQIIATSATALEESSEENASN